MRSEKLLNRAKRMRREATGPEQLVWSQLRADQLYGAKFRRQVVIGPYIADFACRTPVMLVVELDGDTHATQQEYDAERTRCLESRGYRVLRFTNHEVMSNIDGVLTAIAEILPPPLLSFRGEERDLGSRKRALVAAERGSGGEVCAPPPPLKTC
jgi:very-short-patch-repair endonuclease